ncbi:UNVERIFIED_ORG: regulator of CtrA degradation [Martelella mediterranea]
MTSTGAHPISFAGRAANSPQFDALYAEGMTLVEETAAYLDGPGRAASKLLSGRAAALYSAESIRLTTRLMQLASWLLLQRSLNSGEMSREQVIQERNKLRLGGGGDEEGLSAWRELPPGFRDLADHATRLETRIRKLDESLMRGHVQPEPANNQVIAQIDLLQTAFARR